MAMVEAEDRFSGAGDPDDARRLAERCVEAEQRCFRAERRRFEAERQREQAEQLLGQARRASARMAEIVVELKRLVAELRRGADAAAEVSGAQADTEAGKEEMVDALTAAIARLRANVQAVGDSSPAPSAAAPVTPSASDDATRDRAVGSLRHPRIEVWTWPMPVPEQRWPVADHPLPERLQHKHSMSLLKRWRIKRKQRKSD